MIDLSSSKLEERCEQIQQEFQEFQIKINQHIEQIKQSKFEFLSEIESSRKRLEEEKRTLLAEKDDWEKEKQRIQQITALEPIIKLNIGGKEDVHVRKSTLCQVEGSALEAMFSGRHSLQKIDEKIFIDRNPFAFGLMIDFIRNSGQLHEQQKNNYDMLKMELKYWGIDDQLFKEGSKNKFEIIQEMFDKPLGGFFEHTQDSDFLFKNLDACRLNFSELYKQGKFKFKNEFRIKSIRELVGVEYGQNFSQISEIGRAFVIDHDENEQLAFAGQMINKDGLYQLDGFGNYIDQKQFCQGHFQDHDLNGQARAITIEGKVLEGIFKNHQLNGIGKVTHPDGTVDQGMYENDELNGQGVRQMPDGTIQQGVFRNGQLI